MATEVSSNNRNTQPYYDIAVMFATFPDGARFQGTATLVGRNDILTAAHVVYHPNNGGYATKLEFYFGADYNETTNNFEDYGYEYTPSNWTFLGSESDTYIDSDNETVTREESSKDISLISVDTFIGDTLGWLGVDPNYNSTFSANAVGYPAGGTGMMQETVFVHENPYYDDYESDYSFLGKGASGGPLLIGNYVVGVLSAGGASNNVWADIGGHLYNSLTDRIDDDSLVPPLTVDTTPPTVSSFNPADATTNAAVDSNIVVTFSEVVQRGTGTIGLWNSSSGSYVETFDVATSSRLTISGSTLTIDPVSTLANSTGYTVEFASGTIKDMAGNAYAGTLTYDFTTVAVADTTAPTVSTFSPADGAASVAIASNIALTFSEAIQRGSGNIVLKTATGATVATFDAASSANLSLSGNTLTINPSADLAYSTGYTVEFASGTIKDLAGNSYVGTTSYNFSTLANPVNQTLTGTSANESFTGSAGNDTIDGGAGIDTALYSGNRANYTLAKTSSGWTVSSASDGVDTLSNIERVKFAETSIALDISGNAGTTAKILGAVFGKAEVANKTYVGIGLSLLDGGASYQDMMQLALNAKLGDGFSTTDEVTLLYQNLLGTQVSASDLSYWTSTVNSGQFTQASLAVMAADTALNVVNINLVGLAQTGIEYS